jgi:hypothetical protein
VQNQTPSGKYFCQNAIVTQIEWKERTKKGPDLQYVFTVVDNKRRMHTFACETQEEMQVRRAIASWYGADYAS